MTSTTDQPTSPSFSGRKKLLWAGLTLFWGLAALGSGLPAMMSPMLFDAPGSENNTTLWALAGAILSLPPLCLIAAGLPWLFRRRRFAGLLFLAPMPAIAAILALFLALSLR
jgi:hypothetical protein